jgi:hypothetical protein
MSDEPALTDRQILEDAAAAGLSSSEVKGAFPWGPILEAAIAALMAIVADCTRTPEEIQRLAIHEPRRATNIAYPYYRRAVASQYSFFGRMFYGRSIDRQAEEVASRQVRAVASAPPEKVAAVVQAAKSYRR